MKNFEVSTDSTSDLYKEELEKLNIYSYPLTFTKEKDGQIDVYEDRFQSIDEYVSFYNDIRKGTITKTSVISYNVALEYFTDLAKKKVNNIIHFVLSSGLSNNEEIANNAIKTVKEQYPDFNCVCVETNSATIGAAILVRIACDFRDKGKSIKETLDYINDAKHKTQHFVIADDLMYLRRGGRVGSASAIVGTMLNIKPIIVFNKAGKLEKYKKSTGMKGSIKLIADEFAKYTLNKDYPTVYVVHTDNLPMAELLRDTLVNKYGCKVEIRIMGPIIGTHVGPNSVAYAFLSNEERPI